MRLTVFLEHRFERTPDGSVWTEVAFSYPFWTRYLAVFDSVVVVARIEDRRSLPSVKKLASGKDVRFAAVPYYIGPRQYLMRAGQVQRAIDNEVRRADAVILRVPSQLATLAQHCLSKVNHPYGVEVVGDPYEAFAPGAVTHPLRAFFRWRFSQQLRRQCTEACGAAYVTADALQRRYPCPGYSVGVSDVELPPDAFSDMPRHLPYQAGPITLITVGSLEQMYKAPDVLIDAVAVARRKGLDLKLIFIGDGRYRPLLETRAKEAGLEEHVRFVGQIPAGKPVRDHLDQAQLFVLPSKTEGLPRAMIEAMARGLPCIGTSVGGIPELLAPEDMVPPGDVAALAQKIGEVVTSPGRMSQMSARSLEKARGYSEEILSERRNTFYRHVREQTEASMLARERS